MVGILFGVRSEVVFLHFFVDGELFVIFVDLSSVGVVNLYVYFVSFSILCSDLSLL